MVFCRDMKKLLIPLISVIANTYFVLAWAYSYKAFETHGERVSAFREYIPGISTGFLPFLLILLSVISIVLIARDHLKFRIKAMFLLTQGLFTCLLLWQLLQLSSVYRNFSCSLFTISCSLFTSLPPAPSQISRETPRYACCF